MVTARRCARCRCRRRCPLCRTPWGWQTLALEVVWQRRWDRELPAAAKAAYRAAATRGQVDVDFGGGAVTVGAATSRLDLSPDGAVRVPDAGPVAWSALDLLPRCTEVSWAGPDRGLAGRSFRSRCSQDLRSPGAPQRVDSSGRRSAAERPFVRCDLLGDVRIGGTVWRGGHLPQFDQGLVVPPDGA
jgi:hypothetical protein